MKWLKVAGVILGAVTITALGIDAADTLQGSRSTLLGQIISSEEQGICPKGMVHVPMAQSFRCVDKFEASSGDTCPHARPTNELETKENLESGACKAVSEDKEEPWRFVTREQAMTACVKAGKRLPSSSEWYLASVGTPDDGMKCNIDSGRVELNDKDSECTSAVGATHMIGNVWEWTNDDVIEGMYEGRALPESGYVAQVDGSGISTLTSGTPSELFYSDYFWASKVGAYGVLRGGFYGSKSDAGVYAFHAETLPTSAGTAIGFRCVL